jgi:hypothetical protein
MLTSFASMNTAMLFAAWDCCRSYDLSNAKGQADKLGDQLSEADIYRICNTFMTDAEITDFYNAYMAN